MTDFPNVTKGRFLTTQSPSLSTSSTHLPVDFGSSISLMVRADMVTNQSDSSESVTQTLSAEVPYQAVAPPLVHDRTTLPGTNAGSRPVTQKTYSTYAGQHEDVETGDSLTRLERKLSHLSDAQSDDLVRTLSRRSTRRSQLTSIAPDGTEDTNEFNDLLAEIFDVCYCTKVGDF